MNEAFNKFMNDESIAIKTRELVSWLLDKNKETRNQPDVLFKYNYDQLEKFIVQLEPKSVSGVSTYCYVIGLYLKWCNANGYCTNEQYQMISDMDKGLIWKKVKPNVSKRFITHTQYLQILDDISNYEKLNTLYYKTLFQSVYEGVYGPKFTELRELRASNIIGNKITIFHDTKELTFEISPSLAENLRELSCLNEWERKHRSGRCKVKLNGKYFDSCFKIEFRNSDMKDAYRSFYYNKLKKIIDEYIGYKMFSLHIYQSGIMNRICQTLKIKGIKVEDAFTKHNKNYYVAQIVDAELERVGYNISSSDFRFRIMSFIDTFIEEYD